MGAAKQICCSIMICQMTAILSGVALMYLTVIVVLPSVAELEFNFIEEPIMCTTVKAIHIAQSGSKKDDCKHPSCSEWCLTKSTPPCLLIYVMPRRAGEEVSISQCEFMRNEPCSALNITMTDEKLCKKGECKDISGLYNCSKEGENICKEITPAYNCTGGSLRALNKTTINCNEEKCSSRLDGVYLCLNGDCNRIEDKESFHDCERKCEDLNLEKANTVIFSNEQLISGKCSFANSTTDTVYDLNNNRKWKNGESVLLIFCSFVIESIGEDGLQEYTMEDCFNATLREKRSITSIKSFLKLIATRDNAPANAEWLLGPEETLRIINDTQLKINTKGCVNTLKRECHAFFLTHATDGKDGKTPDRFPCYYTNSTSDFVIGNFDPKTTFLYLLLGSIIPATLFVVSCFCLFFCSKSIGVDESGQLKVTLLKKKSSGRGNESETPSILL